MKKIYTGLLLTAIVFSACKKTGTDPEVEPIDTSKPVATNLNNDLLLKMVNDVRASGCNCGTTAMPPVTALTWNNALAAAALVHSKEMRANNYLDHNSPNGGDIGSRLTAAGYKWIAYAENLAQGPPTEQEVFNAWLKSEGHCNNLMRAAVKEMGAARDGDYWTQDFGAR